MIEKDSSGEIWPFLPHQTNNSIIYFVISPKLIRKKKKRIKTHWPPDKYMKIVEFKCKWRISTFIRSELSDEYHYICSTRFQKWSLYTKRTDKLYEQCNEILDASFLFGSISFTLLSSGFSFTFHIVGWVKYMFSISLPSQTSSNG